MRRRHHHKRCSLSMVHLLRPRSVSHSVLCHGCSNESLISYVGICGRLGRRSCSISRYMCSEESSLRRCNFHHSMILLHKSVYSSIRLATIHLYSRKYTKKSHTEIIHPLNDCFYRLHADNTTGFGTSRMCENGISFVGCNQFFSS